MLGLKNELMKKLFALVKMRNASSLKIISNFEYTRLEQRILYKSDLFFIPKRVKKIYL